MRFHVLTASMAPTFKAGATLKAAVNGARVGLQETRDSTEWSYGHEHTKRTYGGDSTKAERHTCLEPLHLRKRTMNFNGGQAAPGTSATFKVTNSEGILRLLLI